ncbi:MAG: biopolymer transporter ExbD [Candidatus Omnitrophica bacterium]|nr:biopolymer transporter ExbD [Candidatus Omnitrophota bacterium]MDD5352643.1 biopolymer transporter ExbD [Candidatus Omnitrophota bacterium]MDD5550242.1 biopolymer transporter ExbD [Candidatus Omnitrophota bacterium]
MRFKRHIELEHGLRPFDIAPLIDIVFQLLIFFMLTSSFIMQPGIKVNLPKAVTSEVMQEKNIVIVVSSENVIYLNENVFTLEELKSYIAKGKLTSKPILIRADKRASLGRVVEIWDLCREMGISQVNIATNQE